MAEIEREFVTSGVLRGGELFLPAAQAIRLVQRCGQLHIDVLGVDAFILTETTTQPVMEHSIDLSWPLRKDPWAEAEAFLSKQLGSGLMFRVVVD